MRIAFAAGVLGVVVASALIILTTGRGHAGRSGRASVQLASISAGQWIRLEGVIRDERPALCTQMSRLTGDFLDDDWALEGAVQRIDAEKREFTISGILVKVTPRTNFGNPGGSEGFNSLRVGRLVEVEGSYRKQGTMVAAEVDDDSDDPSNLRRTKGWVRIDARVERVDLARGSISAMGIVFQLTPKTRLRSVIE